MSIDVACAGYSPALPRLYALRAGGTGRGGLKVFEINLKNSYDAVTAIYTAPPNCDRLYTHPAQPASSIQSLDNARLATLRGVWCEDGLFSWAWDDAEGENAIFREWGGLPTGGRRVWRPGRRTGSESAAE